MVERHCPESPWLAFGVWGGGYPGKRAHPTLRRLSPPGYQIIEQTEFTSSAEISSDWLPRIQAEELRSPSFALVGSSHNQVVERARKTFLCLGDEGFWWGRQLGLSPPVE